MNILDLAPYSGLLISIITLGMLLKQSLTSGEKALAERQTKSETKLIEHDRRIQAVEGELKHLPDRETTHRLELAMAQISGRLDTIKEELKPIKATGDMLTELLVAQAKENAKERSRA
jgi:hypothetical protein